MLSALLVPRPIIVCAIRTAVDVGTTLAPWVDTPFAAALLLVALHHVVHGCTFAATPSLPWSLALHAGRKKHRRPYTPPPLLSCSPLTRIFKHANEGWSMRDGVDKQKLPAVGNTNRGMRFLIGVFVCGYKRLES